MLKTTDAGRTWSELPVDDDVGFSGIGFATPQLGWVGAALTAYETRDGGQTWRPVELGARLNRFRMLSPDLGYAAGRRVYRYRDRP